MAYVALLRGINVGGKALVDMKQLKTTFEKAGLANVKTYINSGNVVFTGGGKDRARLRRKIERDPKCPRYLQTVRGTGYVLKPD